VVIFIPWLLYPWERTPDVWWREKVLALPGFEPGIFPPVS